MSSFTITAKHKLTGTTHEVHCIDDYLGRHRYGYLIADMDAMSEDEFYSQYEEVKTLIGESDGSRLKEMV